MNVLLTGYRGFIGSNLLNQIPKDWSVRYYDLLDNSNLCASDLELDDIDWVLHIGAISSTAELDWSKIAKHNITFSIELFERCVDNSINFQFSSSASVYGTSNTFIETEYKKPTSLYATSKAIIEDYINYRKPSNIKYQMFRYFNVYGPGEEHKLGQSSPHTEFTRQALETGKIRLFEGSDNYKRDFVPVSQIVDTHFQMLKSSESGVWNVGTGRSTSFLEVAEDISEKYNATIEIVPFPEHLKNSYQKYTCADTTKLLKSQQVIGNNK
jgi:ADP-L-glycero-D-manno-heptose 6-epimerase